MAAAEEVGKGMDKLKNYSKGLRNYPGDYKCYINSVVQAIWHLDIFRKNFHALHAHQCLKSSCTFCALKGLFTQFQYASSTTTASAGSLRDTLGEAYNAGKMQDAAECYEVILSELHKQLGFNQDPCHAPGCIVHEKMAMMIREQIVCKCGWVEESFFSKCVHYTTASIMKQLNLYGVEEESPSNKRCMNGCKHETQFKRTLLNCPDVMSIGISWNSAASSIVKAVFEEVALEINTKEQKRLDLVCVLCFRSMHYVTFTLHSKFNTWVMLDDEKMAEVGTVRDMMAFACAEDYQPLLLIYQNVNARPMHLPDYLHV